MKEEKRKLVARLARECHVILSGAPDVKAWIKKGKRILGRTSVRSLQALGLQSLHNCLLHDAVLNYGVAAFGPHEAYTTNQCLACHVYRKGATFYKRHRRCPTQQCWTRVLGVRLHRELISICNQFIAALCQLEYLDIYPPGPGPP